VSVRSDLFSRAKRVVIKLGTAVLCRPDGRLDERRLATIADQVHGLRERCIEVVLVSSGAIGAGMGALGLPKRPSRLPSLQAAAAVGQGKLMAAWEACFRRHGYHAAQVLLTREDFDDRARYLNMSNTLRQLLAFGAVPVVNENDTISVDEIPLTFGDNDILSALVANLLEADVLIMLSVVEGLYDARGRVVPCVERITDAVRALASGVRSHGGIGGMESKLEAARMVAGGGGAAIIADGRARDVLLRLFEGGECGTLFPPTAARMRGRKRWIGFGRRPRGRLSVDEGARRAVVERGKSLLPSGVTGVSGAFERGDLVAVVGPDGEEFARGLVNYTAAEIARIQGLKSGAIVRVLGEKLYDEVIHRDNLALRR